MARQPHVSHLGKHIEGWDGANKRIFILKSAYKQWGQLKQLKNFCNGDAVAQHLLSCYVYLSTQQCQSTQKDPLRLLSLLKTMNINHL